MKEAAYLDKSGLEAAHGKPAPGQARGRHEMLPLNGTQVGKGSAVSRAGDGSSLPPDLRSTGVGKGCYVVELMVAQSLWVLRHNITH